MKSGYPWHVKGVRQRARETAREAARRSGMSVGEWLEEVIKESADEEQAPRDQRQPEYEERAPQPNSPRPVIDRLARPRRHFAQVADEDQLSQQQSLGKFRDRLGDLARQLDARE